MLLIFLYEMSFYLLIKNNNRTVIAMALIYYFHIKLLKFILQTL